MRLIRPTKIRLEASSACQLQCPLCPIHSGVARPAVGIGFLKLTHFERLLRDNPNVEQVELSNYGEIFLNPQLLDIFRCAHERGVTLTADEGVNLNTAKAETLEGLVKYGIRSMTCSIDGATDETYRQYRRNGNLPTVLANIRMINSFKAAYRSTLPRLRWQFVVFGHNEHEIAKARELSETLNMGFYLKLNWNPDSSPVRNEELVRGIVGAASVPEYNKRFRTHYDAPNCYRLDWSRRSTGTAGSWAVPATSGVSSKGTRSMRAWRPL